MRGSTSTSRLRRIVTHGAGAVLLACGLVVGAAASAQASPLPSGEAGYLCTAGGQIDVHSTTDGPYAWTMSAAGSCSNARIAQIRQVTLVGSASTQGLGVCSNDGVIPAFSMSVTATFVQLVPTPATAIQHEVWQLPATTYPVVSPFQVLDDSGAPLGAGEFATHVFVRCPPGGQPTVQVTWSQSV